MEEIKKENRQITLNNSVKISIIAGIFVIALSVAYYVGVFLSRKETTRIEEKKRAETKQLRDECLAEVDKKYGGDYIYKKVNDKYVKELSDKGKERQECFDDYQQN